MATFISLEVYNRSYLSAVVQKVRQDSFLYNLHPLELVYLRTQKLFNVVNGVINPLIVNKMVLVHNDSSLSRNAEGPSNSPEEYQVLSLLGETGRIQYPALLRVLENKPVFNNTANCIDAFKKYFNKSKKFGRLFYTNFGILSLLVLASLVRLLTGLFRDKPVDFIAIPTVLLTVLVIVYLNRLTKRVCTKVVTNIYLDDSAVSKNSTEDWQWKYFLLRSAVLASSFTPLIDHIDRQNSSSCGSSCGSSCSSCGGCGGD